MVYDDIRLLLSKIASVETLEVFDESVRIAQLYSADGYLEVFERAIGESGSDPQTAMDNLNTNLRVILNYLLNLQGVSYDDDVPMSSLNIALDGLLLLADYEDKETILRTLEQEDTPEEIYAELMTLTTRWSVDEALALNVAVERTFITNLTDILKGRDEKAIEEAEKVKEQIQCYKKFKLYISKEPLYADKFFAHLGAIGLPLEQYIRLYLTEFPKAEYDAPDKVVKELVGLACLSFDSHTTPLLSIRKYLPLFFADIKVQSGLDMSLSKFTIGWSTFNAQK